MKLNSCDGVHVVVDFDNNQHSFDSLSKVLSFIWKSK